MINMLYIILTIFGTTVYYAASDFSVHDVKMLGGIEVTSMDLCPQQVSLRKSNKEHFCAGAIVTKEHIVTAAHCMYINFKEEIRRLRENKNIHIVAGQLTINTEVSSFRISNYTIHQNFSVCDISNDIAIIKLATPLDLTQYNISALNVKRDKVQDGIYCNACGWGIDENGHLSNTLKNVMFQILSNEDCQERYNIHNDTILETMICAFDEVMNIEQGDSGGGLICENELVGIIAVGKSKYPAVCTRLSEYYNWIQNIIYPNITYTMNKTNEETDLNKTDEVQEIKESVDVTIFVIDTIIVLVIALILSRCFFAFVRNRAHYNE